MTLALQCSRIDTSLRSKDLTCSKTDLSSTVDIQNGWSHGVSACCFGLVFISIRELVTVLSSRSKPRKYKGELYHLHKQWRILDSLQFKKETICGLKQYAIVKTLRSLITIERDSMLRTSLSAMSVDQQERTITMADLEQLDIGTWNNLEELRMKTI